MDDRRDSQLPLAVRLNWRDMVQRKPPATEEGWYVLHDFRRIRWDAWRDAPERTQDRALTEATEYINSHIALDDAPAGGTAVFSIIGHKADILMLHLRPTLDHLDTAERRFESTAFASYTTRASSYVSVTEVSGYMHEQVTDGLDAVEDEGMRNYMQQRIYPDIPDAEYLSFYPMDKRREEGYNWYDLPFEERKEHMSSHGAIGRDYAGDVTQIITGSIGLDDHEWGVTLFADDMTTIKHLLYEMRFDPSSSKFAEFGEFYVGRHISPAELAAYLEGDIAQETAPTTENHAEDTTPGSLTTESTTPGHSNDAEETTTEMPLRPSGEQPSSGSTGFEEVDAETFIQETGSSGVSMADTEAGYGVMFTTNTNADTIADEVDELRENFDHYDSHVDTVVRSAGGTTAVISLWTTEQPARTAAGFLQDLPGVNTGIGAPITEPDTAADDDGTEESPSPTRPEPDETAYEDISVDVFQRRIHRFGVRLDDYPDLGYGLLFHSDTVAEELIEDVDELRGNFDHYDSHILTTVRADSGDTAVISLWETEQAAQTAAGFLGDLPGCGPGVGAAFDAEIAKDGGGSTTHPKSTDGAPDVRAALSDVDIYAGQPHGEDVYALVLYSDADYETLRRAFDDAFTQLEDDDSHVKSTIYTDTQHNEISAVVSIWASQHAANAAGKALADLPGIVERTREASNFGTMGMFYTVKPEHRDAFLTTFTEISDQLNDTEGHIDTRLMANHENENDMFIASQWVDRDDAMAFFRSDAFRETVEWGREILVDRPRHVFLV